MSCINRSRKEECVLKMPHQETITVQTPFRPFSILDASIRRSRSLSSPALSPTRRALSPQPSRCVSTCTESSSTQHPNSSGPVLIVGPSFKRAMPQCSHIAPAPAPAPVITKSGQSLEKLKIFVGFDCREELAFEVCRHSLLKHATVALEIVPLKLQNLTKQGIYTRPRDPTESTEFSFTRFLTPFLAGFENWAMFVDCDFLYTADVRELAELIDEQYAIMCVHHNYTPKTTVKMDGVLQTCYPRKNWSSMVLYNCAHPKNKLLTPELVNSASGAFLHRFMWLEDADIGELPFTWNFLVGHNELPKNGATLPAAIHFTTGGPWFEAWKDCELADVWRKERHEYWNTQCAQRDVPSRHDTLKLMHIENRSQRDNSLGKSKQRKRLKEGYSIADFMCNALCL